MRQLGENLSQAGATFEEVAEYLSDVLENDPSCVGTTTHLVNIFKVNRGVAVKLALALRSLTSTAAPTPVVTEAAATSSSQKTPGAVRPDFVPAMFQVLYGRGFASDETAKLNCVFALR
ncbi:hypothetical protein HYH02_014383 [Chlamydomonas schloesseri]|uniref:Uncharacterized protein n=1 Tax=Chlamydomonas schloesseri TaxID=2026947 RepID=A0A835VX67_9CHLO|nr:hypothetical protein HYH02_014383 [Chlamydomonas schloesseri]|eukprot:KAG2428396.1 hypothetical protein HYH02_014383 [Chlamydomonas schloesseri]